MTLPATSISIGLGQSPRGTGCRSEQAGEDLCGRDGQKLARLGTVSCVVAVAVVVAAAAAAAAGVGGQAAALPGT